MSPKPNKSYQNVLRGLSPKDFYCSTQNLQLAANIMVSVFNSGTLWIYKKLFCECVLLMSIEILHKLQNLLPRVVLITKYGVFIKPHLDNGDTLYDRDIICFVTNVWNPFSIMPVWP